MSTLLLPFLPVAILLLCLAGANQALPISNQANAALLSRRQFFATTATPSSNNSRSPTVFVAVGSVIVIGLIISLLAVIFSWRRKNRFGPSQIVNSSHDNSGRPIRGLTAGNLYGPLSSKGKPVLTIAELDKLYPVITFADFVEGNSKLSIITSRTESTHSAKTATGNDKEKNACDSATVVVEPTTSTMSTVSEHSHMFQPSSDNYVCAICQQNIGEEEPPSRPMSFIGIDISAPVDPIDSEDIINNSPNNSSHNEGGLVEDLEKNATTTTTEPVASTAHPVALPASPVVTKVNPDKILIRQLPCNHIFHDACIVPWLTLRKACCPLCQFNLRKGIDLSSHPEGEHSTSTSRTLAATDRQADSTDQVVRPEPARVRSVRIAPQSIKKMVV